MQGTTMTTGAARSDKLGTILMIGGLLAGVVAWAVFGTLNGTTPTKARESIGELRRVIGVDFPTSGTGVAMTTQGPAVGVFSGGSTQTVIETDKGQYRLADVLAVPVGTPLQIIVFADKSRKVCDADAKRCQVLVSQ